MGKEATNNVVPIWKDWQDNIDSFIKAIQSQQITHAVVVYRNVDGDLNYQTYGSEHATYLIGMLERVKMEIHGG